MWKNNRKLEREYTMGVKKYMFLMVFFYVLMEGLALAFPMLLQGVTEGVLQGMEDYADGERTQGQVIGSVILNAAGVFGFIILIFGVTMVMEYFGAKFANGYAANIRRKLFNKFQRVSGDTIEEFGNARVLPVLFNDVNWLRLYKRRKILAFVVVGFSIFGSFLVMFLFSNPLFGLIGLGATPFVFLFFWINMRQMKKIIPPSVAAFDDYFVNVKEGITGAKDIRILDKVDERAREFSKLVREQRRQGQNADFRSNLSISFHALLFTFVTIIIIIVGMNTSMQTAQDLVELNTALQYIVRVQTATHMLFMWFGEFLPRIKLTRGRLQEAYDLPEEPLGRGLREVPNFAEPRLDFVNMTYTYANQSRGLGNINISVPFNTRVAISGGIGSGKTILPRLLLGETVPNSGEILFNQIDITSINRNTLRREVISYAAAVPQFIAGTIRDNMKLFAPDLSDADIRSAFDEVGANDFKRMFGENFLDYEITLKRPLPDGTRNLLNLVRAVLKPASLYIFNQCFEHVRAEYIDKLMLRLERERKTALFITYDGAVCKRCDNIYVLKNGRVKGEGKHVELLRKNEDYQKFYASASHTIFQEDEAVIPVEVAPEDGGELVEQKIDPDLTKAPDVMDSANMGRVEVVI